MQRLFSCADDLMPVVGRHVVVVLGLAHHSFAGVATKVLPAHEFSIIVADD